MKKEYIKPEIQVYEIGHRQLLAGSGEEEMILYLENGTGDGNDLIL